MSGSFEVRDPEFQSRLIRAQQQRKPPASIGILIDVEPTQYSGLSSDSLNNSLVGSMETHPTNVDPGVINPFHY